MGLWGQNKDTRRAAKSKAVVTALLMSTSAIAGIAATVQTAFAQTAETNFTVAAGPLNQALAAYGRQSGIQVTYVPSIAVGKQSPGLTGRATPQTAIARILSGSGLTFSFTNARTIAISAPGTGDAGTAQQATTLSPIVLSAEGAFSHVDGYVAPSASTAMKGDISLLETPQSISVVTSDQIKDQGAQSINEALRYTAGVRAEASGAQAMDNPFYMRGFLQSSLDTFQDGLRSVTPGYFGFFAGETYGLERIEVLKGPTSVLYGQQTPGGLLNTVSKRPTANPINEVEVTAGSFDHYQGAFDVGGSTEDNSVMYRVVGLVREADTQVDHVENNRYYFAPSITWARDEETKLTVLGSYQKNEGDFYAQVPAAAVLLPNSFGHIPFSRFLGEPSWEYEVSERYMLGYEFQHRFNENVKFEQNFRYTNLSNHRQYLQANGALVGERILNRNYNLRDIENEGIAVDSRFQFDFDTGPIEHKALVGLDYLWGKSHWLEQRGTAASIDIFNPVYGSAVNTNAFTSRSLSDVYASQAGLYVQDQMKYENFILTLGARQDWAWRDTDNLLTNTRTSQDDDAFTGRAGLTYLTDFGLAPYASYTESFTPLLGLDRLGNPYVPETGAQYEVGVKYQPEGSNSFITLSAFQLARQNVQTTDPVNSNFSVQTGEVRVRGIEVEALASLDNGLSLNAAYTFSDAEITKTNIAGQLGNTPYRVPTHAASLWVNYELQQEALEGLSVGAGVRYIGKTWGDDGNTFKVPEFALVDLALRYDFSKKFPEAKGLSASINVSNLFDKYYVPGCFTQNACNYGSERTIMGKLSFQW